MVIAILQGRQARNRVKGRSNEVLQVMSDLHTRHCVPGPSHHS